ncbi:MAG: MBL fold metallo-hydrolase [Geobacteraceae bacterium GWC2_55_20]|nr:MAG: MBL fold metallo-hydrolase [Geobacteraceae bacterium GWC2_55_20]OGU23117.1 MAG: MBL fold metallo-hydrolase [Geobacteraceae bacterium GWF2_54_21]HBA70838.1 MBL fold metallo-hydrolase [Geobacter sp.]HCE66026.1 MBL fold metallo-hydrolase [Geobacter sp.]
MKRMLLMMVLLMLLPITASAANFKFQKVRNNVYAAIAEPGGKAASNSLIIITNYQVILAGSHFVPETTREILDFVSTLTPIPVRYIILTHHHRGFNHIDFDLPANAEIITSGPTWQALRSEFRQIRNQVTFFDRGLTMKRGNTLIVISATERGHSEGDLFVYLPEEGILFTSDLFFNDVAGYMGDGSFRDWIGSLEIMSGIDAAVVVPGLGAVTNTDGILRFQAFFRAFTTEVLRLIGKGLEIEAAKRQFSLPQYENMPGYKVFFDVNFRRAYNELKALR